MKRTCRLIAYLLILTVFFLRMASEILNLDLERTGMALPYVILFSVALLLWVTAMVWPSTNKGFFPLLATIFSALFVIVEYLASFTLDLVAVFIVLVLFSLSLGKRGKCRQKGVKKPRPVSTQVVASKTAENAPKSVAIEVEEVPLKKKAGKGKFVASTRGRFYHKAGSDWAEKIKAKNKKVFDSEEAAKKAGFLPHKSLK